MIGIRRKDSTYQMVFLRSQFQRLEDLPNKIRELLEDMDAESPAIQRLFPIASSDPEVAREFRDLAAEDIRVRKLENLAAFERSLEGARSEKAVDLVFLKITPEDFEYWIGFLNDIRLLLGTELGIEDDSWDAGEAYEESGDVRILLYDYLNYVQGALLHVFMNEEDELWPDEDDEDDEDLDDGDWV